MRPRKIPEPTELRVSKTLNLFATLSSDIATSFFPETFNLFLASCDFCHLLMTFSKSLIQIWDQNCLTLEKCSLFFFCENVDLKKVSRQQ